jgi:hypothetical protein
VPTRSSKAYHEILQRVQLPKRIPEGLLDHLDAQHEYQSADDDDWNVANHCRPGNPNPSCAQSEKHASPAAIATVLYEESAISEHQIVLKMR